MEAAIGKRKRRQKKAQSRFISEQLSKLRETNSESDTLKGGSTGPQGAGDAYTELIK
jgi:hypothetical protein